MTEKIQSVWMLFPLPPLCWELLLLPCVPWLGRTGCVTPAQGTAPGWSRGAAPAPSAAALPQHTALGGGRESLNLGRFREMQIQGAQRGQRGKWDVVERKGERCRRGMGAQLGWRLRNCTEWGVLNPAEGGLCWKACFIPAWAFLEAVVVLTVIQDAGRQHSLPYSSSLHCQDENCYWSMESRPSSGAFLDYWKQFVLQLLCFQQLKTSQSQRKELLVISRSISV